jgi:hypothetical protein
MKKNIKAAWVKALRSGKYKQGKNALKAEGAYCCLGVLCDLHRKTTKKGRWVKTRGEPKAKYAPARGRGDRNELPERVSRWAGLTDGKNLEANPQIGERSCSEFNDGTDGLCEFRPKTFKQIAKLIEEHL